MKPELEYDDIQSLILYAHSHLRAARFLFLRAPRSRPDFKRWLSQLAEIVTISSRQGDLPSQAIHVAFTATGLKALGLPEPTMKTFLLEFREGMASADRARSLGDVNHSAPERWDFGGTKEKQVDLVLMLYAPNSAELAPLANDHQDRLAAAGLEIVARQDTQLREDGREPFGFVDGIGQPVIEGTTRAESAEVAPSGTAAAPPTEPVVKAGEFILGYRNGYGALPFSPRLDAGAGLGELLDPVEDSPDFKDLGRNGSYLVIRKLEQDTRGFQTFITENARNPKTGQPDASQAEWLAAKLMGRWRSGAPLALDPDQDNPDRGKDPERNNGFDYRDDTEGLRCPIASHVRRTNPRASLAVDTPEQSLGLVSRHRIIRRGRRYLEERATPTGERKPTEGILFLAFNTNIARQFEFIQQSWINNPSFGGLQGARDPIAGANYQPGDKAPRDSYAAVVPALPFRIRLTGIARFVHTRGGAYFFMPGRQALRFLSTGDYESPSERTESAGGGPSIEPSIALASPRYQTISIDEK